jgi:glucosamine--fructose-6-phosphate aminotransferase (isomerizing)
MCGIFGYAVVEAQSPVVVVEGLRELEYRGYDSWGVSAAHSGVISGTKRTGKILKAVSTEVGALPAASAALGHTRWATHGAVTEANAHPHLDCSGQLAMIHNGIVENHTALRAGLTGHRFKSETDSEVVVHLLEARLTNQSVSLINALIDVFARLEGMNAIAVLDGRTGQLAAIKNGSPLVVGLTDAGAYLASDPVALLPHTNRLIFIEDGQAVDLSSDGVKLYDVVTRCQLDPDVKTVSWEIHDRELGPYAHYMEREIDEQPRVLHKLSVSRQDDVDSLAAMIQTGGKVYLAGCGTAHNAALLGQYLLARVAAKSAQSLMASEMGAISGLMSSDDLLIALSQSGETIDVLDAVRIAQSHSARVFALTNSEGSTLYRMADAGLWLDCGPERCVLATKTYMAKIAVLAMAAYTLAGEAENGRLQIVEGANRVAAQVVDERDHRTIESLANRLAPSRDIFVLGRGLCYPMALEAALKIKEVSYMHAEGFAAGELKHGVIALIEPGTPCLVLAVDPSTIRETLSSAAEVKARGGLTMGISCEPYPEFDVHLPVRGSDLAALFEATSIFQILAYQLALALGRDPDRPRNLAKSVTVR